MSSSLTYLSEYNYLDTLGINDVSAVLKATLSELGDFQCVYEPDETYVSVKHYHFVGKGGSYISADIHDQAKLLTIDIHITQGSKTENISEMISVFEKNLLMSLQHKRHKSLPGIARGEDFYRYFPTTDGKLIEYDFDKCLFEGDSKYQNIKIMNSPQFGGMLILDDDPNLAESDILYTQTITGFPHENYRDKSVLILGGGDGGILSELLKQDAKFITMVDIDGVVVEQSRKHLRGICHNSLDQLKGRNYEVLIEDCVPLLEKYIEQGKEFDYVINDLTAIPVTTSPKGDQWDFLRLILNLSMKVLKLSGKYYTQGNGANMTDSLHMYEAQLQKLENKVDFKTKRVFIPSYHELWVFYEIWKVS